MQSYASYQQVQRCDHLKFKKPGILKGREKAELEEEWFSIPILHPLPDPAQVKAKGNSVGEEDIHTFFIFRLANELNFSKIEFNLAPKPLFTFSHYQIFSAPFE